MLNEHKSSTLIRSIDRSVLSVPLLLLLLLLIALPLNLLLSRARLRSYRRSLSLLSCFASSSIIRIHSTTTRVLIRSLPLSLFLSLSQALFVKNAISRRVFRGSSARDFSLTIHIIVETSMRAQ